MQDQYAYLPQDRCLALERGEDLPDHTHGTGLFADIYGFTELTESLTLNLGARRGAEELTRHLNCVYSALIGAVEMFGGSVISFSGDAITCWFSGGREATIDALQAALAMQVSMRSFASLPLAGTASFSLQLKISLATGPARRLVAGNPDIQLIDTLAGSTLIRMARGDLFARQGEILADEATLAVAGADLRVGGFRQSSENGEKFALVESCLASDQPGPGLPRAFTFDVRPWLLPAVYEREQSGLGDFLTELRNVAALFMFFEGIDYDGDSQAGVKLDKFVRHVQEIVNQHGGTLLGLTIGDKGSYCYAAFGAPVAHEDDPRRALNVAIQLSRIPAELPFIRAIRIGLGRGSMRTGAYGSSTRRAYSVLGNEMNLAARLMQAAGEGQVFVSQKLQYLAEQDFRFEPLAPFLVKGKAEPVLAFLLTGPHLRKNFQMLSPAYSLPMSGRKNELTRISDRLDLALKGHGQIVGITAEAGMGKSRLIAEVINLASQHELTGYGGACQSDGVNSAYLVWRAIWRAMFEVDPELEPEAQSAALEQALIRFAPNRTSALPLIGEILGIPLSENDFTRSLDPKDRRTALFSALENCLENAAHLAAQAQSGLLLVLEDVHWMDALSRDLLDMLARAIVSLPVLILLAYRPGDEGQVVLPVEQLSYFTRIELHDLTADEAAEAVFAKLAQLFPTHGGRLPEIVTQKLLAQAQGNPFYLEELLNYLRDRGIDPRDTGALDAIELPESLHTLVLSRIDRLSEQEKTTLKVASIIGRIFHAHWLNGYYPALGSDEQLRVTLDRLRVLDITLLDSPEPELAYIFKHLVTQEVTYESLSYATRALLHEQMAHWLEETLPSPLPLDLLAFHYGRSQNLEKKREYLRKAAEYARSVFANEAALSYYTQLVPLLESPLEKMGAWLEMGAILELIGRSPDAETIYREALAAQTGDIAWQARIQQALGMLFQQRGENSESLEWYQPALNTWKSLGDLPGQISVLNGIGMVYYRKGDYALASDTLHQAERFVRATEDSQLQAVTFNNLANVAYFRGEYASAESLYSESLERYRAIGNKRGMSSALTNLGMIIMEQKNDYAAARVLLEEGLSIDREMGDKWGIAVSLQQLGTAAMVQYDIKESRRLYLEAQVLFEQVGDKRGISIGYANLASLAFEDGDFATALNYQQKGLALFEEMDDKRGMAFVLLGMGLVMLAQSEPDRALEFMKKSLILRSEIGDQYGVSSSLAGLAGLASSIGEYERAARLLGATSALLASLDAELEPELFATHQAALTDSRSALGDTSFDAAWAEGKALAFTAALAYALNG